MSEMTSRERVLRTFRFEDTDRTPCDLMESVVWPELQKWCEETLGLTDQEAIFGYFGVDFRWFWAAPQVPEGVDLSDKKFSVNSQGSYSDHIIERPLRDVHTVSGMLQKHEWRDPAWWDLTPARRLREKHPDRAIAMLVHQTMLFMSACDFFGIEEALVRMLSEDRVLLAFFEHQHEFAIESFKRACSETEGVIDVCWMMDDLASQRTLMMRPDLWRRHLKGYLRRQVEVIHKHNLLALFHSCGAIRDIIPDLIEIGIDGVLPFQTSAEGMDASSIARDFGGRIVFYGGMDVQHLLPFGSEEDVRCEVRKNIDIFSEYGGYIVANSHHCLENIKPENIRAMTEEARKPHPVSPAGRRDNQ